MSDLGFAIFWLTHQNLGDSFCAPKISYQSQKQPVLPLDTIGKIVLLAESNDKI